MNRLQINEVISSRKAFHALTEEELENLWVSDASRYLDPIWCFPNLTPGSGNAPSKVSWKMLLPDGTVLTEMQHKSLLSWARRLMGSLIFEPEDGVGPSPGALAKTCLSIKHLVSWMTINRYIWPSELNDISLDAFLYDIVEMLIEEGDGEESLTEGRIRIAIFAPLLLWRQRHVLAKAGIAPIPQEPFHGESVNRIAKSIATKPQGWVKPLPDEVSIPLFNKAAWFIGMPGKNILQLLSECMQSREEGGIHYPKHLKNLGKSNSAKGRRQLKTIRAFEFSVLDGETQPWHAAINTLTDFNAVHRLRMLLMSLRDACVVMIQGTSGMRISEICGLPEGINQENGLPSCVRIVSSISGLNELFILRTVLSKTEEVPRDVDWVVGMRPKGSNEVPLAVHALLMLNELYAPFRVLAGSDRLILNFKAGMGVPNTSSGLTPIANNILLEGMKNFMEEWVDLSHIPDESARKVEDNDLIPWRESKGRIIKTHQLRKSWAQFTLAVDPRLMPAIQMEFHHISLAMTDGGYIGKNPVQLESLQAVSRQQRDLLIYETVMGKSLLAGRMGEQIEEHLNELHEKVKGLPTSEGWKETVRFCDENDLKIFFAVHGKCMPLSPVKMRCHDTGGTESWLNTEPNYMTREPSLCAGCCCFILDKRHKTFWEDRYVDNWVSYKQAEEKGIESQFRVVRERAEQAGKLLRKIGIETTQMDEKVVRILKELNYAKA